MTPIERYRRAVEDGFETDAAQAAAAGELERIHAELRAGPRHTAREGWLGRLSTLWAEDRPQPVRGLYLWGGVGRGKTWLMNAFHESLPFPEKLREHFHAFMQRIHTELRTLPDTADPLSVVAERLAGEARVVCLDEFHVADIADAMLLGRLLSAMFERGVTLVTTSNTSPDELYKDGLQRARFLPAIELIKTHTKVFELSGENDYRLRALARAEIYHWPLDEQAEESLESCFVSLRPEGVTRNVAMTLLGREVEVKTLAHGIAWFEFAELCDTPRAAADYIELARRFHTLLLGNVPVMGAREDDDKAQRFIQLVDELYEHNVNLIVSAEAPPEALYPSGRLSAPFRRTRSRLEEMQSRAYLARLHIP